MIFVARKPCEILPCPKRRAQRVGVGGATRELWRSLSRSKTTRPSDPAFPSSLASRRDRRSMPAPCGSSMLLAGRRRARSCHRAAKRASMVWAGPPSPKRHDGLAGCQRHDPDLECGGPGLSSHPRGNVGCQQRAATPLALEVVPSSINAKHRSAIAICKGSANFAEVAVNFFQLQACRVRMLGAAPYLPR